ncbi:hypothetical protein MB02_14365 [Croceicoccus estronivorus]|uniref:LysM peptidoglycan-binding domain-containing protein n=1 Tax=Croceicoccus estronivorus TaxID=1172626 RepID=UPI00082B6347|nr:LysM peptidoglycan-binding domain-containing protein [Croceicoccus estronivorus]OCC22946.1 hypothetical protein MB02_14365 [Croceicoccus estronivorus]
MTAISGEDGMVAIFTGAGAGFTRGSANILGGAGQLGGGLLGRGDESVAVNAATGNLLVTQQDEFLVGRGPDIGISRTYNSLGDAADGDNGDNWQQSTTRRVFALTGTADTVGSTISRQGGDGSVVVYAWDDARGAYVTTAGSGAFDTLTQTTGVWTWTDGDSQTTETYAAHGSDNWRIVSTTDIDGNSLTYSYQGEKLDTVTTADGAWTQYLWSGNNITEIVTGFTDLATSTSQTLTRTRYAYDASDRLIMVTTDLSPQDNAVSDGNTYTVTYTYDGASNRIASIAQTDGSLLEIAYDGSGRVAALTQTVAAGDTRVTSLAYGSGHTEVTGPDGQVTRLDYDAAGQLTAITAPPAYTGATAQQVQFAYDAQGNLVTVTDAEGNTTAYEHDANGNVTRVTDANANVVERTYDSANRLITELAYGSGEAGANVAHYAQYAYDVEGHLRYAVNGAGQVTEYEYTAHGELARRVDYPETPYPVGPAAIDEAGMNAWVTGLGDLSAARIASYTYDARGNRTAVTAYGAADASGNAVSTDGFSATYQTYDQAGQLLSRYRAGELAENFIYDGLGRLVASTDVNGGTTTIVFNDTALTTTVTTAAGYTNVSSFNKAGELVSQTGSGANTAGGTATYAYDANGRLRIVSDATGRTSYTVYDRAGRKVADVNHLGEIVEYQYDQANRLVATVRHADVLSAGQLAQLADPDSDVELSALLPVASSQDIWNWTIYDDGGRAIESIGSDGSVATFEYDQSDRLVKTTSYLNILSQAQLDALKQTAPSTVVLPGASGGDAVARQFYNGAGQIVGTLDGEGYLTEIVYDAAGQKLQEIAYATVTNVAVRAGGSFAALRETVVGASTVDRTAHYVYDGQGQLRFTVDGAGGVRAFAYDSAGRLTTTTEYATRLTLTDFAFDTVKAAIVSNGADRVSYTVYDASGRAAYAVDAEGGVTGLTYDTSGRVVKSVQFADLYEGATGLPSLAEMDGWAANPAHASDTANRVDRNWYSERGELLYTVDAGNYVRGFVYDAEGRKIGENAWPNGVVVADAVTVAQVAAAAAGAGSPIAQSYSYDNAGRLLTSTDGEGFVTRNAYDALGQLVDVYVADGTNKAVRAHYEYDAAGRLVAAYHAYGTSEQVGSFYAYDGLGNRISTTDANGHTTTYNYDELGQVLSATNALGGVTAYEYDAFGNVVKTTDPKGNATYSYYDSLNRLIATRDAAGYVSRTIYNRFGDVISVEQYSLPANGAGETGVAVFDPELVPEDPYEYADGLQAIADDLDAQAAQAESDAVQAQADADAAAQAASDADAVVDDLEAQLALLGSGQAVQLLQAQIDQAQVDATAAHALADAAQADADTAWAAAAPLRADADAAQSDADTAQAAADAAVANAGQLHATADSLDAQAAQADTAAVQAEANATAAAQAAAAADAVVDDLQDQLDALGGGSSAPGVDYSAERAAALADPVSWLGDHRDWLKQKENSSYSLMRGSSGEYSDQYGRFGAYFEYLEILEDFLEGEANNNASDNAVVSYINGYFDHLDWKISHPFGDINAAYSSSEQWIDWRESEIKYLIEYYMDLRGGMQGGGPRQKLEHVISVLGGSLYNILKAKYDIENSCYSIGWDSDYDNFDSYYKFYGFYLSYKISESVLYARVSAGSGHPSDYRANVQISAYYDVGGEVEANASPEQILQAQLNQAITDADAAHDAADAAQLAAGNALAAATQLHADADQAELDAIAADGDAQTAATYAAQLQADVDALDLIAAQAEAAAAAVQADADALAQAASDADAAVASLQAQMAELLNPTVDYSSERAAALADMNTWLSDRQTWLNSARIEADNLASASSGLLRDEFEAYADRLEQESYIAQDLRYLPSGSYNEVRKANYINQFFDNLTSQANNLPMDRAAALADPEAWLESRKEDLSNWIDSLYTLDQFNGGSNKFDNTYQAYQAVWATMFEALYDLEHNTYSTNWPDRKDEWSDFYEDVRQNPNTLPNNLQHSSQHASNYRAVLAINAYFDFVAEAGSPYTSLTPEQLLQLQLGQANASASTAHAAADGAQVDADTAAAMALQMRADATQAQLDADAAYADALANSGIAIRDHFVLLNLGQMGPAAVTNFGYDRLGRTAWKVDAEGYPEFYQYNAFGQQVALSRYSQAMPTGQVPDLDGELPPEVVAAYDHAAQLQAAADAIAAQIANAQADLANALANPLPYLQSHLDDQNAQLATMNAELADLQEEYDDANIIEQWFVLGPQIDALEDDISDLEAQIAAVEAEVQRVQNGQGLTNLGTAIVEANFDPNQLQGQLQAAQVAADQALADAQALETQSSGLAGTEARTQFVYDNRGQLTRVTDAQGYFETFGYDAFGRRVSQTAKSSTSPVTAGATTTYTYDKRGLLLSETLPIASRTSSGSVQSSTVINRYFYDARGNRIKTVEADGLNEERTTEYTYDNLDRLIETRRDSISGLAINTSSKAVSSVSGRPTETIAYDALGNVIRTVDAAGAKTVFFYDDLNRKAVEINALGTYTAYEYDANGDVTRVRVYDQTSNVPATGGQESQAPNAPNGTSRETQFSYDNLGRMTESRVIGVTTGGASGSNWNSSSQPISTSYEYDYLGNLVKVTDPNGNKTWNYYDRLGRKTAQVDGQNYLTRWTLDFEGNVTEERRYANSVGNPGSTSNAPSASNNSDDRITQYTYDLNGNRLSEKRLNVKVQSGNGGYSTVDATISYQYNGLGQVVRKTEATGDQTEFVYDAGGRLTREVKEQSAADYYYDGLGNLTRNVEAAVNGSSAHVTTYAYGAGGRLTSMTDAGGYVHGYFYDEAGRLVLESYVRDGRTEAIGHRYDVLGRNLGQAYYIKSGSNWAFQSNNDYSSLQYNVHGEVTKIGINGLWQQENKYDGAGRIWATNAGDGIWKYYGYDKNGNQTLAVTSAGYDLAGLNSITAAYAKRSQTDVNATITAYDGRNLATKVVEEGRQLSTSSTVQLTSTRSYNAFGEVASETDANGGTVTYTYNTMGRVITAQSPQVAIVTEAGTTQNVRPTENYYYDKSGRLTGQRDANGNLTRYTLQAGSGYGGTQALVRQEIHADGGTVTTVYDAHGNAIKVTDEVGLIKNMSYDNLGRLTQVTNPGGLVDYYTYDVLGQRLTHYNSLLGAGDKEITGYDIQGRITSQRAFGGDTTTTSYVWNSAIATGGLGTFGGWIETTGYANGKTLIERSDLFDRTVQRTDLGGNVTNFSYDEAGRLASSASGLASNQYTYYNTGQIATTATTTNYQYYSAYPYISVYSATATSQAAYTYDKTGNRLTELGTTTTTISGVATTETWKNQTATYDALGRMKTWKEAGTTTSPAADLTYSYDAAGNVRHSVGNYSRLDASGAVAGTDSQDYWFRYDSMNRLVVDRGVLSDGEIRRNHADTDSLEILYDQAGRRTNVVKTVYTPGSVIPGGWGTVPATYLERREIYNYNAAGSLSQVDIASGSLLVDQNPGTPPESVPSAPTTGTKRSSFTYDAMGRLTRQLDYDTGGANAVYDRAITYNAKSQITAETVITKKTDGTTYKSVSSYSYNDGAGVYTLGSVGAVTSTNTHLNSGSSSWKNDKGTSDTYTYIWRDGAVQSQIRHIADTSDNSPTYYTNLSYDAAGRLTSAYIADGKPRYVTYRLDENGQIIKRDETRPSNAPSSQTGSPHEIWYRFGGREMGYTGNNGTSDVDYTMSIAARQKVAPSNPGTFRDGSTIANTYADFAQSYDPINSFGQGAAGGTYTVRTGDTLQSVAQSVWGDANLWYKLAEANGISGNAGLIEGQVLQLPAGVMRNTHNAGTVNPYDPSETIGNLSPTTPKPPKKNKCGGLGAILLATVAVAVAAFAGPGIVSAFAKVGGALAGSLGASVGTFVGLSAAGAVSSAVSQGVGLATGIQDNFSWKAVGMSALKAVVAGLPNTGDFFTDVVRGAFSEVVGQGVALAVGLQSKFDFAGVAAAGIGAGVFSKVNVGTASLGRTGSAAVSGVAAAIANAATRSAVEGSSFGGNLSRAVPNAVGSALGGVLAGALSPGGRANVTGNAEVGADVIGEVMRRLEGANPLAEAAALDTAALASPIATGGITIGKTAEATAVAAEFRSTSSAEQVGIVVTADRQMFSLIKSMSDYQFWNLYYPIEQVWRGASEIAGGSPSDLRPALVTLAHTVLNTIPSSPQISNGYGISAAQPDSFLGRLLSGAKYAYQSSVQASGSMPDFVGAKGVSIAGNVVSGGIRSAVDYLYPDNSTLATNGYVAEHNATNPWYRQIPTHSQLNRARAFALETIATGVASAPRGLTVRGVGAEGAGARGLGVSPYVTNGDLVESIATRADDWGIRNGLGNGPVAGTIKHGYAEEVLTRYQRMFGDRGLIAEARYAGGAPWQPGIPTTGSIRLDVVEGPLTNPTQVWDYKFGQAKLSESRITQIQNGIPNGANVPILMVKP